MTFEPRAARRMLYSLSALILALAFSGAASAAGSAPAPATSDDGRFFQSFAEDAAIVRNQWWEGGFEFTSGQPPSDGHLDVSALMINAAFQPLKGFEFGGRVGFGSSSADGDFPDGNGATDMDIWGKWHVGGSGKSQFVVGALATVPTGDDTAGLGYDAFNIEGFGAMRYRMTEATLAAHLGFRINSDGHFLGYSLDGKTSAIVGMGLIFPVSDQVGLVGEANMESERWEGADSDFRLLVGVNWRPLNKGMIRGAVSVGLTDGAPDGRLQIGYAYTF